MSPSTLLTGSGTESLLAPPQRQMTMNGKHFESMQDIKTAGTKLKTRRGEDSRPAPERVRNDGGGLSEVKEDCKGGGWQCAFYGNNLFRCPLWLSIIPCDGLVHPGQRSQPHAVYPHSGKVLSLQKERNPGTRCQT